MELLSEKGITLSNEQLNTCLNDIMRDLTVAKEANNQEKFLEMLNNVIQVLKPIEPANCYSKHPLIIHVLRDSFIKLLDQELNQSVEYALTELAKFFEQYVAPTLVASGNTKQSLIDGIGLCLAKKVSGKTSYFSLFGNDQPTPIKESIIPSLHTLLCALENCKDDNTSVTWVDILIDCVCCSTFVNTFRSIRYNEDDLTENQKLLLIDRVMQVYQYNELNTVTCLMQKISSRSLPIYAQLLIEFVPPRKPIHVKVLYHFVKMLQFLAIDNDVRHQFVKNHELVIDSLLVILNDDILWGNINDRNTAALFENASNYIFLLSLESDLLPIIKAKPNVAKCMLRLTTAQGDTEFNGYRTLAMIMTEEELKQLAEPEKITAVFIKHMNNTIDVIQHRRRLENLLLCLKSLVQHDLIRDEFAKSQSGLPLLIRCATQSAFDRTVVKQRSLELLLVMTFNEQAVNIIRNQAEFLTHIDTLSHSEEWGLQRVAESILWRLKDKDKISEPNFEEINAIESVDKSSIKRNKEDFVEKSNEYEFDIMISYSHDDKKLVYQIADKLEKENYRIWLDRNNMYGSATRAMAHAIENSEFVFICMSDSYKQSGFCEMEANYALQMKRSLIPLIVRGPYRADGWLGLITTNKIYIDFHKHSHFDEAYSMVIQEITRHRNKPITKISPPSSDPTPKVHTVDVKPEIVITTLPTTSTLPPELRLWSTDDVNQFLKINKLETLLPICTGMDGSVLSGLYTMCQINSYGMFESLKGELARLNASALPIATYLKFLEEIKKYVPAVPVYPNTVSLTCTLM